MSDTYTRLHGTTTDSFKVGSKNQRITLTGQTVGATTAELLDRHAVKFQTNTTVFFTAYVVGKGTNTAAFEIKGCYLEGTTTVSGYVVDTYVNSADFPEPSLQFTSSGEMTLECTGVPADTTAWTAVIDFVSV